MTLHYVPDERVDSGPVIATRIVPIGEDDTAPVVRDKLIAAGTVLLDRWLARLASGKAPAQDQDQSKARVWRRRRPKDGRIDWSRSDRRIRDLTRALAAPWPGASYQDRSGRWVTVDRTLSLEQVAALRREVGQ